ncbi:MAG: InlB B-repeat-containing protein [Chitinivibrionia bacterium]|nr:InlB B-repeat-containing protein [Chitinivibrionia bacterium]
MKTIKFLLGAFACLIMLVGCDFITGAPGIVDHSSGGGNPVRFTVNFNANGGTSVQSRTVNEGEWIELPSTSRNDHTFDGWHTSNSGGSRVGGIGDWYEVRGNATLHARWTQNNGGNNSIVGTWGWEGNSAEEWDIIVFNADGTGTWTIYDEGMSFPFNFSYHINGTTITLNFGFLGIEQITYHGGNTLNWDGFTYVRQ